MAKIYDKIEDLFKDKIFYDTDLLIIWGKRGRGKSSFAGKLMAEFMQPRIAKKEIKKCNEICNDLAEAGFNFHPPKDHLVFCDTYFESRGYMQKRNSAYRFNGVEFGLPNSKHQTMPIIPCGKYFFDEAQDLFDSHISALQTFVTKSFELSRQVKLFLAIIAQRPIRIHKDIRELATFVEVVKKEDKFNKYGSLISSIWTLHIIYDNAQLEDYVSTKSKKLIDKKVKVRFLGNIHKCYDSNYFMPMFYRNFENTDFVLEKTNRTEFSSIFFKEYFNNRIIDIPETYRGKKK